MSIEPSGKDMSRQQLESTLANLKARRAALELRIGARETLSQDASVERKELDVVKAEIVRVEDQLGDRA